MNVLVASLHVLGLLAAIVAIAVIAHQVGRRRRAIPAARPHAATVTQLRPRAPSQAQIDRHHARMYDEVMTR